MSHTIINVMHVAKITINTSTCIHFQGGIVMLCTWFVMWDAVFWDDPLIIKYSERFMYRHWRERVITWVRCKRKRWQTQVEKKSGKCSRCVLWEQLDCKRKDFKTPHNRNYGNVTVKHKEPTMGVYISNFLDFPQQYCCMF